MPRSSDPRRLLPAIDRLLDHDKLMEYKGRVAGSLLTDILRGVVQDARERVLNGEAVPDEDEIVSCAVKAIQRVIQAAPLRVINATGIILHTGLGRAPLSRNAVAAVVNAAGYCDLEYDLRTGARGDRQERVERLLCWITGAESAIMVNNNAAALFLVLSVLGYRKEVVVSRGQLIEIGGSFRLPDIMLRAGCKLVEVGTTNRTRISDYASAITDRTVMLLRAYPSNYRIEGFAESVEIAALSDLAHSNGLICVDDLGGGLLWDWTSLGMPYEPNVAQSLSEGADLVLVSGDKVLGGPQAGLIIGKKSYVQKLKRSPLSRVLRPGKLEIAALASTLTSFLSKEVCVVENPTWRMLVEPLEVTRRRAVHLREKLQSHGNWRILEVTDWPAQAGSGTLPATPLNSSAVVFLPMSSSVTEWASKLRNASIPVVPIVQDDKVVLNLRTVADDELDIIVDMVRECLN